MSSTERQRATHRLGFSLSFLLVAWLSSGVSAHAQSASWLDQPLHSWSNPNDGVPAAPQAVAINPRCGAQERAPIATSPTPPLPPNANAAVATAGNEESGVAAAGWKLETYWPTQRKGELTVVLATSNYDGMCRPWGFNGFMFYQGRFAGTLSPVNMDSRSDGVLVELPSLSSDSEVSAEYTRYAPSDALCCPSRGRTTVVFRRRGFSGAPLMIPEQAVGIPPALPKTGGSGPAVNDASSQTPQVATVVGAVVCVSVVLLVLALTAGKIATGRS